jgi:TetR/AcrR family transcriptional regulator, ethionamide resistance regulator
MAQVIEAGQADGSIRPELAAATTASALVWMVERECQQNLPNEPPDYDPELVRTLTEIAWGALYLKPASQ